MEEKIKPKERSQLRWPWFRTIFQWKYQVLGYLGRMKKNPFLSTINTISEIDIQIKNVGIIVHTMFFMHKPICVSHLIKKWHHLTCPLAMFVDCTQDQFWIVLERSG